MLYINKRQTVYYESPSDTRGNVPTRIWGRVRDRIEMVRRGLGVDRDVYALHWRWMGDLSGKRVLDLGCNEGNVLSIPIAEKSESYLGIDLSRPAIEKLRNKLREKGLLHADAQAVDFLSDEFTGEFDVVYAHGVAHHFKHFEVFLKALERRLAPNGIAITLDPLQTSLPVKVARALYRPFQADSEWEWPFTKRTFELIQEYFEIEAVQGIMGHAKWSLLLAPFSREYATRVGSRLHSRDLAEAHRLGRGLWRCMVATMCWRKRTAF